MGRRGEDGGRWGEEVRMVGVKERVRIFDMSTRVIMGVEGRG